MGNKHNKLAEETAAAPAADAPGALSARASAAGGIALDDYVVTVRMENGDSHDLEVPNAYTTNGWLLREARSLQAAGLRGGAEACALRLEDGTHADLSAPVSLTIACGGVALAVATVAEGAYDVDARTVVLEPGAGGGGDLAADWGGGYGGAGDWGELAASGGGGAGGGGAGGTRVSVEIGDAHRYSVRARREARPLRRCVVFTSLAPSRAARCRSPRASRSGGSSPRSSAATWPRTTTRTRACSGCATPRPARSRARRRRRRRLLEPSRRRGSRG